MKAINRPAATSSQFKTFTALSPFPVPAPFAEARYSPSRHAGYSFPPNIPAQHILLPTGRHVPAPLYRCPYISSDVSRRDAISKRSQWAASKGRPEKDSAAPARLLRAGCVKTHLTLRRLGTHTAQAYLPLLFSAGMQNGWRLSLPVTFPRKNPCVPCSPRMGRISRFVKAHKNTVRVFPFCCPAVCAIDAACMKAECKDFITDAAPRQVLVCFEAIAAQR